MVDESYTDPIGDYLSSIEVGFRTSDGGIYDYKIHRFGYTGKNVSSIDCSIHFGEEGRVFTVFGMVSNNAPKDKVKEVLEICNEANYRSRYGTMIIDTEDGSFWSRHGNASASDVDHVVFDAMIKNVCRMIDDFYPLIMKVIYGDKTAKEVIKEWRGQGSEKSVKTIPSDISGYQ